VTIDKIWIGNWIIEYLQIVAIINYSAIANSHTVQFTTAATKSFHCVFTSRCLVTASTADVLFTLGSPTTPVPQLPGVRSGDRGGQIFSEIILSRETSRSSVKEM
jgi:hypothetical protein